MTCPRCHRQFTGSLCGSRWRCTMLILAKVSARPRCALDVAEPRLEVQFAPLPGSRHLRAVDWFNCSWIRLPRWCVVGEQDNLERGAQCWATNIYHYHAIASSIVLSEEWLPDGGLIWALSMKIDKTWPGRPPVVHGMTLNDFIIIKNDRSTAPIWYNIM